MNWQNIFSVAGEVKESSNGWCVWVGSKNPNVFSRLPLIHLVSSGLKVTKYAIDVR